MGSVAQYLWESVGEARWWVEASYEDNCPAFRDHAASILRQVLKEIPCDDSPNFKAIHDLLTKAYGALRVGQIHEADEILQEAIQILYVEVIKDERAVQRNGRESTAATGGEEDGREAVAKSRG